VKVWWPRRRNGGLARRKPTPSPRRLAMALRARPADRICQELLGCYEEPASEAGIPQRPRPPVEKPFFAATAFGFTCYILAQQSANSDHFWQVYAPLGARKCHRCAHSNPKRALPKEPKRAHWSEREGSEHRGILPRLGCPDGRAEAGLAMLAVGRRALTARDGFSGFAGRLWASVRLPGRGPQTRRIKDSYSVLIALICCRGRGNCPDLLRRPDRRDARFPDL
jgi:hypothetical protein